jgi:hypothetical protein
MGHILEKIKKIFFYFSVWTNTKRLIVWVIFWRKLKKKHPFFFAFLYGLTLQGYSMGRILKKIKKIFFYVSVWIVL